MRFLKSWFVCALAIALAIYLVPGIVPLGDISLVVNAVALEIASWLSVSVFGLGIYCTSFGAAFWGALVISVVSAILNAVIA